MLLLLFFCFSYYVDSAPVAAAAVAPVVCCFCHHFCHVVVIVTHVVVRVVVYLHPVLEPYDLWPRLSLGHADEDDLVAQLVLVVEVRRLRNSGALKRQDMIDDSNNISCPISYVPLRACSTSPPPRF